MDMLKFWFFLMIVFFIFSDDDVEEEEYIDNKVEVIVEKASNIVDTEKIKGEIATAVVNIIDDTEPEPEPEPEMPEPRQEKKADIKQQTAIMTEMQTSVKPRDVSTSNEMGNDY